VEGWDMWYGCGSDQDLDLYDNLWQKCELSRFECF